MPNTYELYDDIVLGKTTKRFQSHIYRDLIPRNKPAYIGVEITNADLRDPHLQQRLFAPKVAKAKAIVWTQDRQASCMDRGFFLHRTWPYNFVNILSPAMCMRVRLHGDPFNISGDASLEYLCRMEFETQDKFYDLVLRFITQQDRFGWSSTWHCALSNRYMRWYKALKAEEGKSVRDRQIQAVSYRLRNPTKNVNDHMLALRALEQIDSLT